MLDLTDGFRVVAAPVGDGAGGAGRPKIVALTSPEYYSASVGFARYEDDVTQSGLLGYACIVAERA